MRMRNENQKWDSEMRIRNENEKWEWEWEMIIKLWIKKIYFFNELLK